MNQQPRPRQKVYFSRARHENSHHNATPESEKYGVLTISRMSLFLVIVNKHCLLEDSGV